MRQRGHRNIICVSINLIIFLLLNLVSINRALAKFPVQLGLAGQLSNYGIVHSVEIVKAEMFSGDHHPGAVYAFCATSKGMAVFYIWENPNKLDKSKVEISLKSFVPLGSCTDIKISVDEMGTFDKNIYAFITIENEGLFIRNVINPELSWYVGQCDVPGDVKGVYISGNYAYAADGGRGLQIIDITNKTRPYIVGSYDTSGSAQGVYVDGNYAYVAAASGGSGLQIIDIKNKTDPKIVGSYDTSGFAQGVYVDGNYAYVAAASGGSGLQIIDIKNKTDPKIVGLCDTIGSAYGVYVDGNYAYVAHGSGLQVIDITNKHDPNIVGSCDTSGSAHDVYVDGNYAYVAHERSGLQIIDIKNKSGPNIVGSYDTNNYAFGVYIAGNYAYVADGSVLKIIDIKNKTDPKIVGSYDTSGSAQGVYVDGNYAYVADGRSGLQIIDIRNKAEPNIVGSCVTGGDAQGVYIGGNYAYVTDGSVLQIIDITNKSDSNIVGSCVTGGYAKAVYVAGDYAYVADGRSGLQIIDITNKSDPHIVGTCDTYNAIGVYMSGNYAYVADDESGLQIIDITNKSDPHIVGSIVGSYVTDYARARGVYVDENYAYVADWWKGLQVIDIRNKAEPNIVGSCVTGGSAEGVYVDGNYAYVADYWTGLQIIDIKNKSGPNIVGGSCVTIGYAYDVYISGNYAYVADERGLQVIDIRNKAEPNIVGSYVTGDSAEGVYSVYVDGNYAYVAASGSGGSVLKILDIRNKSDPKIVGSCNTSNTNGSAYDVYVTGNYAYVAAGRSGLQIIDIRNKSDPKIVGSFDNSGSALGVYVAENYAYVADGLSGLQIIDITNKSDPNIVDTFYTGGYARGVYIDGNYAYVSAWESGLQIIDITNKSDPNIVDTFYTGGYARGVYIDGNYAYVSDDESGLKILDITNKTDPKIVGSCDTIGYALGVYVDGNYAYVANWDGGFLTFNIAIGPSPPGKGNLVLVAGGNINYRTFSQQAVKSPSLKRMKTNNSDQSTSYRQMSQKIANYIFTTFKNNGYEPYDIYYFNPELLPDVDEDGIPDQMVVDDFTPTALEFIDIITNWPQDHIANDGPLYIYLIGHGAEDTFLIMPNEVITAKELRNAIDAFQHGYTDDEDTYHAGTNRQVIVIIESAASSTFIDDLKDPNINVTIITSTDHGASFIKPNYKDPGTPDLDPNIPCLSFTAAFIHALGPHLDPNWHQDNSFTTTNAFLKDSFIEARTQLQTWASQGPPFADQAPQMALPDTPFSTLSFFDSNRQVLLDNIFLQTQDPSPLTILGDGNQVFNPRSITFFSSDPNILHPDDIDTNDHNGIPKHWIYPKKNGRVILIAYADPNNDSNLLLSAKITIEISDPNLPTDLEKMVLIVAGYRETGDYLWDSTNEITNHGYKTLRAMGYTKDEIYYYNPYLIQSPDEIRGYPHPWILDPYDSRSPFSNIQDIKELFIFLADHGNREEFYMNPKETLSFAGPQYNSLLEHLTGIAEKVDENGKIIFLYDACHSGSFLQKIQQHQGLASSEKLITITSTDPNQTAYFLNKGLVSFSHAFFDEWFLTRSLLDAFNFASYNLPLKGQTPCISDPNIVEVWDRKKEYYVDESRPAIDDADAYKTEKGELYITARVFSLAGIKEVWAIVESAQKSLSAVSGDAVTDKEATILYLSPAPEDPYFDTDTNVGYYKLITPDPCPDETNYNLTIYASDRSERTKVASVKQHVSSFQENRTFAIILASDPNLLTETGAERITAQAERAEAVLKVRGLREQDIKQIKHLDEFNELPSLSEDKTLFVYLTGNTVLDEYGTPWFLLNPHEQIDPETLMSRLPADPNGRLLILMDTPYAKRFLEKALINCSGNWKGIASTDKDNLFFPVGEEGTSLERLYPSFSIFFFSGVLSGTTIAQAYRMADNAVSLTWQGPQIIPQIKDYKTMNLNLGYHLGISAIAGDDYTLFTDCSAHVDSNSLYTLTLTPHPDADPNLTVWAVLNTSPSSLHEHNDIMDLEPLYDGNSLIYSAKETFGYDYYSTSFMVEGRTKDKTDVTWCEWKKVSIVQPERTMGEDIYEPDDDPNYILFDTNHQILVNHTPTIHTFYCPDPNAFDPNNQPYTPPECDDIDWVYFYGLEGHVYEIYALDLSEYGYYINLTLIDPNGKVHTDDNFLSFECSKSGLCFLHARLASSYPEGGVEYLLSVYNPQAEDITDIYGWIHDSGGMGLNGLWVELIGPNGYYRYDITRNNYNSSGQLQGGYYHIEDVHAFPENLSKYSLRVSRLNGPILFEEIAVDSPTLCPYHINEIGKVLDLSDIKILKISYDQEVDEYRVKLDKQIERGTVWYPPGGDHDTGLPPGGDFDGDGLTNQEEVLSYKTSPLLPTVHVPLSTGMNPFYASCSSPLPIVIGRNKDLKDLVDYYYYDPQLNQKIWEKTTEPEIKQNHFNALFAPEPGVLYLDLTRDATIPVLALRGFWDANNPEIRFFNSPSCIDRELFNPEGFCPEAKTLKVLKDPNLYMIHTINHKNPLNACWESTYHFFGKPAGKDVTVNPYNVLFVTKDGGEMD